MSSIGWARGAKVDLGQGPATSFTFPGSVPFQLRFASASERNPVGKKLIFENSLSLIQ
jgi:hypothetical protein